MGGYSKGGKQGRSYERNDRGRGYGGGGGGERYPRRDDRDRDMRAGRGAYDGRYRDGPPPRAFERGGAGGGARREERSGSPRGRGGGERDHPPPRSFDKARSRSRSRSRSRDRGRGRMDDTPAPRTFQKGCARREERAPPRSRSRSRDGRPAPRTFTKGCARQADRDARSRSRSRSPGRHDMDRRGGGRSSDDGGRPPRSRSRSRGRDAPRSFEKGAVTKTFAKAGGAAAAPKAAEAGALAVLQEQIAKLNEQNQLLLQQQQQILQARELSESEEDPASPRDRRRRPRDHRDRRRRRERSPGRERRRRRRRDRSATSEDASTDEAVPERDGRDRRGLSHMQSVLRRAGAEAAAARGRQRRSSTPSTPHDASSGFAEFAHSVSLDDYGDDDEGSVMDDGEGGSAFGFEKPLGDIAQDGGAGAAPPASGKKMFLKGGGVVHLQDLRRTTEPEPEPAAAAGKKVFLKGGASRFVPDDDDDEDDEDDDLDAELNRYVQKSAAGSTSPPPAHVHVLASGKTFVKAGGAAKAASGASPTPAFLGKSASPAPELIVGTSTELEKEYHRGEKNVEVGNVRPVSVLKKAFEHITAKHPDVSAAMADYPWLRSQLKAIRQDLVVQGISSGFTWDVYQYAMKLALRAHDGGEFMKCLAQLKRMEGALERDGVVPEKAVMEMCAYRILFHCLKENAQHVQDEVARLPPRAKKHGCIKHALATVKAHAGRNYHRLALLIPLAPNLGGQIFKWFLPALREAAYVRTLKSYRDLPLTALRGKLFFAPNGDDDAALKHFLKEHRGVKSASAPGALDCVLSLKNANSVKEANCNPQFADLRRSK
eukprot:TRINITY_DN6103_c0_g1_i1.p1 TRINITY_DN6103_c0_g1~~TRINITY_DN6103_c0_g1_i1.p1  ORF type:complete len:827 (+),score=293.84 TRINITY_DN6103_c0_g1_i1:52-2532(+)